MTLRTSNIVTASLRRSDPEAQKVAANQTFSEAVECQDVPVTFTVQ